MQYLRTALLLLPPWTLTSAGCHPVAAARPESASVRVDRAPEHLEARFVERLDGAPSPEKRTSLYGLSFVLPKGWYDESEVVFWSDKGPLLKLAFFVEPLSPAELDEWMERAVRDGNVPSRGTSARIHRFDNPALSIRGLEVRGHKNPGKQWIVAVEF